MERAQHAAHNPKFDNLGLLTHPGGDRETIEGPAHMAEGDRHLRERP